MTDRARYLAALLGLAAAACADPFGPGSSHWMDATIRLLFDCSAEPVVPEYCGTRRDTAELSRVEIHGQLQVTHVRDVQRDSGEDQETWAAQGLIETTSCDPDCQVLFRGIGLADITRSRRSCAGLVTPFLETFCAGRSDGTVTLIVVSLRDPPGVTLWGLDLGGSAGATYVDPTIESPPAPGGPRTVVQWSLD